jgi:hypothetical protein
MNTMDRNVIALKQRMQANDAINVMSIVIVVFFFSVQRTRRYLVVSHGFYFGKYNGIGSLEYIITQAQPTEQDTITFGIQTLAISAQIFRLESTTNMFSLDYEIVCGLVFNARAFVDDHRFLGARPVLH